MPNDGIYAAKKITTEQAVSLFKKLADNGSGWMENYESAIGHQATADAINLILGLDGSEKVPVNRKQITMNAGDEALCFRLASRLTEGSVLTDIWQIDQVGYEFVHVWKIAESHEDMESDAARCGAAPITGTIWRPASEKVWSDQLGQYV